MMGFFRIGVLSFALLHAARGENLFVYFGTHTAGPGKGFSLARFDTTTGALSKPQFLLEAPAPAYFIIAPDGKHLYTCNSTGFVSAYAIDGATARLTLLDQQPSGGIGERTAFVTPRNFDLDRAGRWMLVTNHGNNVAMVFRIDQATGKLTPVGSPVEVPYPFCPRFLEPR